MSRAETLVKRIEPAVWNDTFDELFDDPDPLLDEAPSRTSGVLVAAAPAEETAEVAAASWAMTVRALRLDMEAVHEAVSDAASRRPESFTTSYVRRAIPAADGCAAVLEFMAQELMASEHLEEMNLDAPLARLFRAASDWLERVVRELIHLLEDAERGIGDDVSCVEYVGVFSAFDMRMSLLPALTDARLFVQEELHLNAESHPLVARVDDLEDRVIQLNWVLRVSGF